MQLKSKTSNGVIYLIGYPSAFDACPAGDVQIYVGRVAIRPETSSLIGALCFDGCFDQISFDGQISPQTRDVMMGCGIAVNENGVYDIPKTRSDTSDYSFVSTSPDQTGFSSPVACIIQGQCLRTTKPKCPFFKFSKICIA